MGLYDDDAAAVTGGDQSERSYWHAKAYSVALEAALQTRQPESKVGELVRRALPVLDAALAAFPNHEDAKKWRARALAIQERVDPRAPAAPWRPDFPWALGTEAGDLYFEGWVALHWARCARDAGDWIDAYEQSRTAAARWDRVSGAQRHMKKWPEGVQKDVAAGHDEAREIFKLAATKR